MSDYSLLKYDEMFFEAEQMIQERDIVKAVTLLEEIIEEQPDYGKAHSHLGWLYENEYKDYLRSEKHYRAALAFSPEYPLAYMNFAVLLSRLERFVDLKDLLDKAIKVQGIKKSDVHHEYGIMFELQSKFTEAMGAYRNAILNSLITKDIEMYQGAIERCLLKTNLLNGEADHKLVTETEEVETEGE